MRCGLIASTSCSLLVAVRCATQCAPAARKRHGQISVLSAELCVVKWKRPCLACARDGGLHAATFDAERWVERNIRWEAQGEA
ncbi:hypothetical protein M3J09_013244 [Ascochyta lentis]